MSNIPGEHLIGFSDFFDETMGAAPAKPAAATAGPAPGTSKGKPPQVFSFPKPPKTVGMKTQGAVLAKARDTLTKGAATVKKAALAIKAAAQKPAPGKPSLITAVKRTTAMGAAAQAQGKLTPKAQAALKKQQEAVKKAATATKSLQKKAVAAHGTISKLAKQAVNHKKTSLNLRKPPKQRTGAVKVGELLEDPVIGVAVAEELLGYYEAIGAAPDPTNPGYLDDGSPDPAYWGDEGAGGAGDLLSDDPVDSGQDFPPAPAMDQFFTAAQAQAAGAIYYNGEKGYPQGYAGSLNLWTRKTDSKTGVPKTSGIDPTDHFGYVWGQAWDTKVAGGLPFGDDLKKDQWNHVHGRHILLHSKLGGACSIDEVRNQNRPQTNGNNPEGVKFGPIVGNPNMPDFAALRFDDQLQPFYLPQEAPDWLLFPLKQQAALTAQANAKAAADAAAAQQAALDKVNADGALAQAQQDAQTALTESQASSDYNVQQMQMDTQASQQMLQQQASDTQAQNLYMQQAQQAGNLYVQQQQQAGDLQRQSDQLLINQAALEQQYYQQHPEAMMQEMQAPQDGGGGGGEGYPQDDGGGEGDYEDGNGSYDEADEDSGMSNEGSMYESDY